MDRQCNASVMAPVFHEREWPEVHLTPVNLSLMVKVLPSILGKKHSLTPLFCSLLEREMLYCLMLLIDCLQGTKEARIQLQCKCGISMMHIWKQVWSNVVSTSFLS